MLWAFQIMSASKDGGHSGVERVKRVAKYSLSHYFLHLSLYSFIIHQDAPSVSTPDLGYES